MERKERRHHTREFKLEAVRLAAIGDKTKAKDALYRSIADDRSAGLADLVGLAALFGDDPRMVNAIPAQFDAVTAADIQRTARAYLRPEQRSTFTIKPGAAAGGAQ